MKALKDLQGVERQKNLERKILILKDLISETKDIVAINLWTNKMNGLINELNKI